MKQICNKRAFKVLLVDVALILGFLFTWVVFSIWRAGRYADRFDLGRSMPVWIVVTCFVFLVIVGIAVHLVRRLSDITAWYGDILDGIPFSVSVVDNEARWVFLNRRAEGDYGVDRRKAVGQPSTLKMENIDMEHFQVGFDSGGKAYQLEGKRLYDRRRQPLGYVLSISDMPHLKNGDEVNRLALVEEVDRLCGSMSSITMRFAECTNTLSDLTTLHVDIMERLSITLEELSLGGPGALEQLEQDMAGYSRAMMDNSGKRVEQMTQLHSIAEEVIRVSRSIVDVSKALGNM